MAKGFCTLFVVRSSIFLGMLAIGAIMDAQNGKVNHEETAILAVTGVGAMAMSCGGTALKRRALEKRRKQFEKE